MQDLEKLIKVAEELKAITLRLEEELLQAKVKAGKEAEILGYSTYSNGFHVTEEKFLEITNGDAFTIKERDSDCYKYEYQYFIQGRMFYCISDKFWDFDKPKDEDKEFIVTEDKHD